MSCISSLEEFVYFKIISRKKMQNDENVNLLLNGQLNVQCVTGVIYVFYCRMHTGALKNIFLNTLLKALLTIEILLRE